MKEKKDLGIRNLRNSMKFSKDKETRGDGEYKKAKVIQAAGAHPPAVRAAFCPAGNLSENALKHKLEVREHMFCQDRAFPP